jgi:peptidoglycan/xylan/chitin deacetylase (PgdA/CDA1 family)
LNFSYTFGKWIHPRFIWRIKTEEKQVFITFDDGPHPTITPWVLSILKEYEAKASFFVVGENAKKYPLIIDSIIKAGHSIGNHTQRHLKGWSVEAKEYLDDIEECNDYIPQTNLFRPPYGRINNKAIAQLGDYKIVMWDNLSRDYKTGLNKSWSLKRLIKNTVPGSVVVFHDSLKAEENLKFLLPKYLEYLKYNGYKAIAI